MIQKGVVFSLSGFGKNDRDVLRDHAQSMGKEYRIYKKIINLGARFRDELYDGLTTHLISNGKNPGKYAAVRTFYSNQV